MSGDWRDDAACRGKDPTMWDTPQARAGQAETTVVAARHALAVCAGCPVAVDCHLESTANRPLGVIRAGIAYDDYGIPANHCQHCGAPILGRNGRAADYCTDLCQSRAAWVRSLQAGPRSEPADPKGVGASRPLLDLLTPDVIARFWRKVRVGGPDECWPWTGEVTHRGHGRIPVYTGGGKVRVTVHRVAWTLEHEQEIGPFVVRATCEERRCCNPAHLRRNDDAVDEVAA